MVLIDDLNSWIKNLRDSNKIIIVEGKKDKHALELLGIKNIITLNKPLFQIVEDISKKSKKCILLVDLDKEGKILYAKLKKDLQRNGVKTNDTYRNFLYRKTNLKNIEGISNYANKINETTKPFYL